MNCNQKPITPTKEESKWINSHQLEHGVMLWRYAAMANTLDISWLDGCIAHDATYSSQSVFEDIEGENRILVYLSGKLNTLKKSGNGALVRATLAELPETGIGADSRCVAIYQAQSEFDQSAWIKPVCCMAMDSTNWKIHTFFMVTVVPSPINAFVSNLFPMASIQPKARPALRNSASFQELSFYLFLLDGECPIDVMAREQVKLVIQGYSGAIYCETTTFNVLPEVEMQFNSFGFIGFPSLAITLRGKVLYRHTGLISADRLECELHKIF